MRPPTPSRRARVGLGLGVTALIALVCAVDSRVPEIVFSPFYLVPVCLAAWFLDRRLGFAAAFASAACGLLADAIAGQSTLGYAIGNSALRLGLLTVFAVTFGRLRRAIDAERRVAEREREAASRLLEAAELRAELMRSVALDAREPLGRIYAKIVDLGFGLSSAAPPDSRALLDELAQASSRLTELVDKLLPEREALVGEERVATTTGERA